jgi:hypothetical protein
MCNRLARYSPGTFQRCGGWLVYSRPCGLVQVVVPSGLRLTCQPAWCLGRWSRRPLRRRLAVRVVLQRRQLPPGEVHILIHTDMLLERVFEHKHFPHSLSENLTRQAGGRDDRHVHPGDRTSREPIEASSCPRSAFRLPSPLGALAFRHVSPPRSRSRTPCDV